MDSKQQELFQNHSLPPEDAMYTAFISRDGTYEGIFWTGVTTTGIFCRPECTARKPKRENVVFFGSQREALLNGYRPCKICRPMQPKGTHPQWLAGIMDEIDKDPTLRLTDADIRERGIDPNRLRRWFKREYGMTFQAYLRLRRLGRAFGQIREGAKIIDTAFDAGFESLSGFTEAFTKAFGFSPTGNTGSGGTSIPVITLKRLLTPLGPMLAGSIVTGQAPSGGGASDADENICLLEFVDRRMLETQFKRLRSLTDAAFVPGESHLLDRLQSELIEYFGGKRKEFTVPLFTAGSAFQQEVWRGLTEIPYSETRSYAEQAKALGKPEAVRAVARANGDNRIAILIPCHRVIGADGSLTGYGGGLWRKQYLLDLEQRNM